MVLANRRPSECVFMQSGDDVKSEPTCLVEPLKVRVDETLQQTCWRFIASHSYRLILADTLISFLANLCFLSNDIIYLL